MPDTPLLSVRSPQSAHEWNAYFKLRWRILRAPWGQPPGSERDEHETTAVHRMVCDEADQLLAVGRLHCAGPGLAQIRYMAVTEARQRQGIGTLLLQALETAAVDAGWQRIVLHARASALPFYRKHGYRVTAASHLLYDEIQHFKMSKQLSG